MFFALFLLVMTACNDTMLTKVIDSKPEIMVHPTEIFFGHVKSGHETEQDFFSIINVGNATLYVEPILMDGSTRYNIPDYENEELILQPGEILDVLVDYAPITYEHNGAVVKVISNDEENDEIFVTMEGYGDAPKIIIDPEFVNYGDISIGCDNEYRVTIDNIGNLELEIDNVVQMTTLPNDIYIDYGSLPLPPWNMMPGEQIDLLVKYTPSDIGDDESIVKINSNDPLRNEVEISQKGKGDVEHWIIEEWVQEEEKIYDILWVIDNSGSMRPFQNRLAQNIGNFVSLLSLDASVDYRLGFITTDYHRLIGPYIDNNTNNPADFASSEILGIGTSGSGNEKGLQELALALEEFDNTGEFIRYDAELIVIFVSDEKDNSALPYSSYINTYDHYKPVDKIKMYAVIGDYPEGCRGSWQNQTGLPLNANAVFGEGYYEVVNHYGGVWYSICKEDWSSSMTNLASDITIKSAFFLEKPDPIVETIEVYVNGQLATTGWTYDIPDNKVQFDENSIPSAGQTIRIEYATYGCGDQ